MKRLHALFVDKERLEHLEHGHVRVRYWRPRNRDEFLGCVEPRSEQVLSRAANRDTTVNPEVVNGEKRVPER